MIGMGPAYARLVGAWWRTRRLASKLRTRADVDRWQERAIAKWMTTALPRTSFYSGFAGTRFEQLPIIEKATVMSNFSAFNGAGVTAEAGWRILAGEQSAPEGFHVGASTGTSGNRGLYVISEGERFEWLGVILAKALPRYPVEAARVALALPQTSALYSASNRAPRLSLRFFDLRDGLERIAPQIAAWKPDTLIAPPKVLRWLGEKRLPAGIKRVFSAAEVLDPPDRAAIEAAFGVGVREIYMATEGLLGVACERGTLHLAEDAVCFEFEPVGVEGLVSPLVTDFTRTTQVLARYRMNDLMRLRTDRCPCGSPLRAVAEVVGRADDILSLPSNNGYRPIDVTPDVIRNAILSADRRITDFRLVQVAQDRLQLALPESVADLVPAVVLSLETLLARIDVRVAIDIAIGLPPVGVFKLRRVERRWRATDAN